MLSLAFLINWNVKLIKNGIQSRKTDSKNHLIEQALSKSLKIFTAKTAKVAKKKQLKLSDLSVLRG